MFRKSARQRVEQARGEWTANPRGNMITYICNKTGVPESEVWDYLLGRRT